MPQTHIIITVRDSDEAEAIENTLREGEENGELDFAFNCYTTERIVTVGTHAQPQPVHATVYSSDSDVNTTRFGPTNN